jgi:hypothetical protein
MDLIFFPVHAAILRSDRAVATHRMPVLYSLSLIHSINPLPNMVNPVILPTIFILYNFQLLKVNNDSLSKIDSVSLHLISFCIYSGPNRDKMGWIWRTSVRRSQMFAVDEDSSHPISTSNVRDYRQYRDWVRCDGPVPRRGQGECRKAAG